MSVLGAHRTVMNALLIPHVLSALKGTFYKKTESVSSDALISIMVERKRDQGSVLGAQKRKDALGVINFLHQNVLLVHQE